MKYFSSECSELTLALYMQLGTGAWSDVVNMQLGTGAWSDVVNMQPLVTTWSRGRAARARTITSVFQPESSTCTYMVYAHGDAI